MVGQDLEVGDDGAFRIVRKVAKDRVISVVDPDARHGHKTAARKFDGFKGHVAVDPDSEVITRTVVTPGNAGDASVAANLIEDLLGDGDETEDDDGAKPKVYGDNAYGTGEFQSRLEHADIASGCKTQPPTATGGLFTKDRFNIDLGARTITCPKNATVPVRYGPDGNGTASFGRSCTNCVLRACCTTAACGRTIGVGAHEDASARARDRQKGPNGLRTIAPPAPRSNANLGTLCDAAMAGGEPVYAAGDESRCRFHLLAAATNLARLAVLGLRSTPSGWTVAKA